MRTGYINHFSHVAHNEINSAYESMFEEDPTEAVNTLNRLKKFINETIRDCKEAGNSNDNDSVPDRDCASLSGPNGE